MRHRSPGHSSRAATGLSLWLLLSLVLGCQAQAYSPQEAQAPELTAKVAGVSLGLFASDPFWDYGSLVDEIAEHHASDVMVVVPLHQDNIYSSDVRLTLPPQTIQRTLRQVRARGLRLTVMPIVQLDHPAGPREWRGRLDPEDPERWWSNYRAALKRIAGWAEAAGADRVVVGSELCSLEADLEEWRGLIESVRARFAGSLTYSANWDHYRDIAYWPKLDEVSVTAYFPVNEDPALAWRSALREMKVLAARVGRPLLISEYGYPAIKTAGSSPWDQTASSVPDHSLQADLIRVALTEIDDSGIRGGFLWNWFGQGGSIEHGYSPRGRPSAEIIKQAFGGTAPVMPGAVVRALK